MLEEFCDIGTRGGYRRPREVASHAMCFFPGAGFSFLAWRSALESQSMYPNYSENQNRMLSQSPTLAGTEFRHLQTRSHQDMRSLHSLAENTSSHFSLRDWIAHQLEWKPFRPDPRAVDAVRQLSEACKQQSGELPSGAWIPLSSLTRDLTASGTTALVTNGVSPTLQGALQPHSAIMGGATILTGLSGSGFSLPVVDAPINAASAWVAEGTPGPTLQPSTRLATLVPKSLIFEVRVSRRLMQQTSADMERVLRAELLKNTLQAIDEAALIGAGPNEPPGLLADQALQVLSGDVNGAAPTWAHLAELEHQVGLRAGNLVAPAFVTSPAVRKKLRTTQRGPGLDYILADSATSVMGQPLRVTSVSPDNLSKGSSAGVCSSLLFGDLSEVIVGFWGPAAVDVLVDGFSGAPSGVIKLIVRAEVGVVVRDIRAFACYKDLLAQ